MARQRVIFTADPENIKAILAVNIIVKGKIMDRSYSEMSNALGIVGPHV